MNNILVSAIISTYNSENFIEGKIKDLLNQSISPHLEIIIVNSGSKQNEEKVINNYLDNSNFKYIHTAERETIYKAWNRGIKIASGSFITNANTDDRLKNDALERMVEFIQKETEVALVYSNQKLSNTPNETFVQINNKKKRIPPNFDRLLLLKGYMAGSQSLWRSSLHFNDNLWFNESYEVAGDYDFICRVAEKYKIKKVNKTLGVFYKSPSKSNKEDQNLKLTHHESIDVKNKYGRRFINNLNNKELKKIELRIKLLSFLPGKFWAAVNKLCASFMIGYFTLDKVFICWVLSLIEERKKDIIAARKTIEPYKSIDTSGLIKTQLKNLKKYNNRGI